MTDSSTDASNRRVVEIRRVRKGVYLATNERGAQLQFGSLDETGFTPTELLLAAIAGCSAVDVDVVTERRSEATEFVVTAEADAVRDASGNSLQNIDVRFRLRFPEGEAGEQATALVPRALRTAHERTCTVSRTIEAGTPVTLRVE